MLRAKPLSAPAQQKPLGQGINNWQGRGGAVQGTIMAQTTKSKSRAFIEDAAVVNDNTSENTTQSVAVRAESTLTLCLSQGPAAGRLSGLASPAM